MTGLGSAPAGLGTGRPVLQQAPVRVFGSRPGVRIKLVQDLLAERPSCSVVFQKQGVFVAQLGLEVQLFRLLEGKFFRVFFSDLQEEVFPLHGIEADNHFFVDGVELGAEPFVEGSEIGDSGVEPIFAHFEVVPEHVVFELSQWVPARRKGVTAVFGHHNPEGFEARN